MVDQYFCSKEYIDDLVFINSDIKFKELIEMDDGEKSQLARLYCTIFNADNKRFIKERNVRGRTVAEGLWVEAPYTLSRCEGIVSEYATNDYFGILAYVQNEHEKYIVGATVFQERTYNSFLDNGYRLPFSIPKGTLFWCEIDTLRRNILLSDRSVKHLASEMRKSLIAVYKKDKPVLLYGSTNNPIMVKSWRRDGWTIVEKPMASGNKAQAYKLFL